MSNQFVVAVVIVVTVVVAAAANSLTRPSDLSRHDGNRCNHYQPIELFHRWQIRALEQIRWVEKLLPAAAALVVVVIVVAVVTVRISRSLRCSIMLTWSALNSTASRTMRTTIIIATKIEGG